MKTTEALKVRHAFENIRNNYVGWEDNPNFKVLESALSALSASTNSAEQQPNNELVCRDAIALVCEGWTLPADARKILEKALWSSAPQAIDSSQPVSENSGLHAALQKAFMTLQSSGGTGRTIILKFNHREDAYTVHDFLLGAAVKDDPSHSQPVSALTDEEMPPLPHTTYNGYGDGSEPLYTQEQMRDYARSLLSATSQPNLADFHNGDAAMWIEDGKVKAEWNSQPSAWNEAIGAIEKLLPTLAEEECGFDEQGKHYCRPKDSVSIEDALIAIRALRQQAQAQTGEKTK